MNVEGILKTKGSGVVTIERGQQIVDAARTLHEKRIGATVVVDDAGHVCGVLSERDIVRAISREGTGALHQSVSSIMTAQVIPRTHRQRSRNRRHRRRRWLLYGSDLAANRWERVFLFAIPGHSEIRDSRGYRGSHDAAQP